MSCGFDRPSRPDRIRHSSPPLPFSRRSQPVRRRSRDRTPRLRPRIQIRPPIARSVAEAVEGRVSAYDPNADLSGVPPEGQICVDRTSLSLTLQTLNAIPRFECHNPFLRLHNLL